MELRARLVAFIPLLRRDERGQGLAEYALILGLIAAVAIIALIFLGSQINDKMSTIGSTVESVRLNH